MGKQFKGVDAASSLQFGLSLEFHEQIQRAAKRLFMSKSALCRAACRDFIGIYCPEVIDPNITVIEPYTLQKNQLPAGWNGNKPIQRQPPQPAPMPPRRLDPRLVEG